MTTRDTVLMRIAGQAALERVHYFPRQLIGADDMNATQDYAREKLRRHNRYLHGWGVVCGCVVTPPAGGDPPWQVTVQSGYVITPRGDEICIPGPITFDLAGDWRQPYDPCPAPDPCRSGAGTTGSDPTTVYLAVCYSECKVRPVRIHPAGCGCDDDACEYSRIRESFELVRLDQLPESYTQASAIDAEWQTWLASGEMATPLPNCPARSEDDCVVLATIKLSDTKTTRIPASDITYGERRVLFSASVPQTAVPGPTRLAPSLTPPTQPPTPALTPPPARSITPTQPPGPTLSSMVLARLTVVEGQTVRGTVKLSSSAPASGTTIFLKSSDTTIATVPSSIMIASGGTQGTFTVTTIMQGWVRITASVPGSSSMIKSLSVTASP